jgi:hypothetical protein
MRSQVCPNLDPARNAGEVSALQPGVKTMGAFFVAIATGRAKPPRAADCTGPLDHGSSKGEGRGEVRLQETAALGKKVECPRSWLLSFHPPAGPAIRE